MKPTALFLFMLLIPGCAPTDRTERILDRHGRVRALVARHDGLKHGPVIIYDTAGAPVLNGTYAHDLRDGVWWGVSATGRPLDLACYSHGMKHGLQCSWWPNGVLRRAEGYRNGKPHGPLIRFRADGRPEQFTELTDGANHGRHVRWWYAGDAFVGILVTGFERGARTGTWTDVDADGRLIWAAEFVNDRMVREIKARPKPTAAPSQGS